MGYDVYIQDENRIVLCVINGKLDAPSAMVIAKDARERAYKLGYGILYDVTNVTLGVTLVDAYRFARDIGRAYEDPVHRRGKAAFLYKSDADFWQFYETTARNVGASVMAFHEQEEALKWLSGDKPS